MRTSRAAATPSTKGERGWGSSRCSPAGRRGGDDPDDLRPGRLAAHLDRGSQHDVDPASVADVFMLFGGKGRQLLCFREDVEAICGPFQELPGCWSPRLLLVDRLPTPGPVARLAPA